MESADKNEKYKNGYIYYLYDPINKRIYIGSSRMTFSKRMSDHKYDLKAYMGEAKNKLPRNYRSSFDIIIQDKYESGILEKFPCDCRRDLEYREFEWIKAIKEKNDIEVVNIKKTDKEVTQPLLHHSFFNLPDFHH